MDAGNIRHVWEAFSAFPKNSQYSNRTPTPDSEVHAQEITMKWETLPSSREKTYYVMKTMDEA